MTLLELVSVETSDGVRLDGTLRMPRADVSPSLPIDLAILHHGTSGNFYGGGVLAQMQDRLVASGCPVLRVNSRGHDIAHNTPKGRMGAAYEIVDDCRFDWRAWLDFAEARGFQGILLWGHSQGALKTIYYLAKEQDSRVRCAVASSPPRFSYSGYLAKQGAEKFRRDFQRAQALIESGQLDELMDASLPIEALHSASVYVDKYGPEERYDVLGFLPNVTVPLLVTIGSLEGTVPGVHLHFSFDGLAGRIAEIATGSENVSFEAIAGAEHSHAGKYDELWSAARRWLSQRAG